MAVSRLLLCMKVTPSRPNDFDDRDISFYTNYMF